MALDIDAVLDAEYVLITERCRTEGLICAVRKLTQYDLPRLPGVGGGEHDAQPFVCRKPRHQNWPPHFAFWRPHDEHRLLAGRGSIDPSLATPFKPEGAVNRERDIEGTVNLGGAWRADPGRVGNRNELALRQVTLCRLPFPTGGDQPRGMAVLPLPAQLAHGRGDAGRARHHREP